MLKCIKFKRGGDLDFFCKMFENYLKKHRLKTIAYYKDPTAEISRRTNVGEMLCKREKIDKSRTTTWIGAQRILNCCRTTRLIAQKSGLFFL